MTTSRHSLDSLSSFLDRACQRYWLDMQGTEGAPPPEEAEEQDSEYFGVSQEQLGYSGVEIDAAWDEATQVFQDGEIISGIVTGWNRGGLLVRWSKLQGFVPISQLREVPIFENDDSRDETLAGWVGEELALRVIELDKGRNRLVFSERATLWGPKDGERLLDEITPGQAVRGYISNLCDFGAFVDLGGVDGLIHISELSWGRVNHPRELLRIGQEVEVYVLGVDRENRRIALSLKRLRPNPWITVEDRYHIGQVTEATITNLVDFGAFAQLEEGIEGLIHISELSKDKIEHPTQVVDLGDEVLVRILRINSTNHRLGLSVRQASESPLPDQQEVPLTTWDQNPPELSV